MNNSGKLDTCLVARIMRNKEIPELTEHHRDNIVTIAIIVIFIIAIVVARVCARG